MKFLCAALCLLTICKFSRGIDTLSANQSLADREVLISRGQIFELGFFSPGSSTGRFLGVWYKATPDIVVWVANRENPIVGTHGVLTLAKNGTLILRSAQSRMIWSSSGSSMAALSPVLQLLDTGNLVLADRLEASESSERYLWQSFDYLSDTRIPGMQMVEDPVTGESKNLTSWRSGDDPSRGEYTYKIENKGVSQIITMKGTKKIFRMVFWNGHFPGFPILSDPAWNTEPVTRKGRLISLFFPSKDSVYNRITMNYTGLIQRYYMMREQKDGWILMLSMPSNICDNYGHCGYNSICKIYKIPVCECLRGFRPKSGKEWNKTVWKSGCIRINPQEDCQKEDGFLKVKGIRLPDSLNFRLNTSMSISACHDECLKNCNCTAYADPYFNNETNCLMWFGDLIDISELVGEDNPSIYIRVPASELEPVTDQNDKRKGPAKTKIIVIAAAASFGVLVFALSFGGIFLRSTCNRQDCKKTRDELELPLFDLETIAAATKNFSRDNMIGEGGFGPVYKGNLSAEQVIAVKRMLKTSGQGHEEFKNEVNLIAKLQHKNLVRILGCCTDGEEKMLIYEYMQNKSLDYFIFDQNRSGLLTWPTRFDIIMGIAKGLLYLHHDSRLKIIHRDLKASNVLLDENLNAKISDFGLARIFEGDQTTARTKRVVGTYGYMAPEYALEGKFSIKSDIFSLGVVILEIVSGKRNRGFTHPSCYQNLLEMAWFFYKENRELELMDLCYNNSYVESQIKRCIQVGLLCIQNVPDDRPTMSSVVFMLNSEDTALPQPNKPGFLLQGSSSFSNKNASGNCSLTISEVEAR